MKDTPEILNASFTYSCLFQCSNITMMFEISTVIWIKHQDVVLFIKSLKLGCL